MLDWLNRFGGIITATCVLAVLPSVARGQQPPGPNGQREQAPAQALGDRDAAGIVERQTTGTVTSAGRGSISVRTDEGRHVVFALDRALVGLPPVEPGARVTVFTAPDDNDPAPTVLGIERLPPREGLAVQPAGPIPADVQRITSQIERQARRFRAGVITGVALDPEMISLHGFATLTPWAKPRLAVRPGAEFAFGEITTLMGLNIDVLYSLPGVRPLARWAPYIGAGPNFSFSHRGVDEDDFVSDLDAPEIDNDRFDFSQWDWNNGFNFIVGARNPSGTFFEMKGTSWGVASIRVLGGFEF